MTDIVFLLNGEAQRLSNVSPTHTLLDWLRETRHLTGTKEGCNEGDCGACTVMVTDNSGAHAMNACILLLPQLNGKAVRTIEGMSGPDGTLHPVQQEMVEKHGSQCGFCTPGIVVSLATAHLNGETNHDDVLAGNLCRCTGYAPIIRAAEAASQTSAPEWMKEDLSALDGIAVATSPFFPQTTDALATWYSQNPDATLVAGATDIGLWVTKQLRELPKPAFLNGIEDLRQTETGPEEIRLGAGVTLRELGRLMADLHPSFAAMIRRFGSVQVRNAATLGGNIANGSPIGDTPPPLIALGARLHLRKGDRLRDMPLEDFFVDYGKQDRKPGEFLQAVTIPRQPDNLRVYKVSKRFDQDISALCGAFNISVVNGVVSAARIAFGGMAAIPKRARHVEKALTDRPWTQETIATAAAQFARDFTPLSDMRASADYRLITAQNLLRRCFEEMNGMPVNVLEVQA